RRLLGDRLARRGVSLSVGLGAALLASGGAAAPPAPLTTAAVKVGLGCATGTTSRVAALAEAGLPPVGFARVLAVRSRVAPVTLGAVLVPGAAPAIPALPEARPPEPPQPAVIPQPRGDHLGDALPVGAVARLGTVRLRHGERVWSVSFSPDGKVL